MIPLLSPLPASSPHHRFLESVWIVPAFLLSLIISLSIWFAWTERERALEHEYRVLETQTRIVDSHLSAQLSRIERLLRRMANEQPTTQPRDVAYEAILAERIRTFPELQTLMVINADGRVEATPFPSLKGFDALQREYLIAQHERGSAPHYHVTRPFRSDFGDDTVVFSAPIRDANNQLLGITVAAVNHRFFERALAQALPSGDGCMAAIFNESDDLLYRHPGPQAQIGGMAALPQPLRIDQPLPGGIATTDNEGMEWIHVRQTIGDSGIRIAIAHPLDQVLADWRHDMVLRALIVVLAAAVTLFLAWLAQRRQREILLGDNLAKQLIESTNMMLVAFNSRGEILAFNEAAEAVSGYRRDEVLGRKWFDTAISPEHCGTTCEKFKAVRNGGQIPPSVEYSILTKDGQKRLISWRNSPVLDGQATIALGIDITERMQVEKIKRSAEVSRGMVEIQEEERRRLAMELHDRTSPNLSALEINWKLLAESVREELPDNASYLLDDAAALIDDTIQSIRAISTEFRPPVLDHAGFWTAVDGYAQNFSRRTGIAVQIEAAERELGLPPAVETNLFRIVQEALANCAKHSQAKTITISQAVNGNSVSLSIVDDGGGFDLELLPLAERRPGHGLLTMQKRAEFIGGRFSLQALPGKGTQITVEFTAVDRPRPQMKASDNACA